MLWRGCSKPDGRPGGELKESSDQDALELELARAGQAGPQGLGPPVRGLESLPTRARCDRQSHQMQATDNCTQCPVLLARSLRIEVEVQLIPTSTRGMTLRMR